MSKKTVAKGGIIGVALGALAGILFAPKSGKQTRADIKSAAAKANKEAEDKLKILHGELMSRVDDANKEIGKLKGKAEEELKELIGKTDDARGKVSELISSVRNFEAEDEDVNKALDEGKKLLAKFDSKKKPAAKKAAPKKPAAKKAATKTSKKA